MVKRDIFYFSEVADSIYSVMIYSMMRYPRKSIPVIIYLTPAPERLINCCQDFSCEKSI